MGRTFDMPAPRKRHCCKKDGNEYAIILIWGELEYDVKYALWRMGAATFPNTEDIKMYKLTDDDEDYLLRSFSTSMSDLESELSAYCTRDSRMATDEINDRPTQYNIHLRFDDEWFGSAKSLANFAHEYAVHKAVAGILAMHNDARCSKWDDTADKAIHKVLFEANKYLLDSSPMLLL